MPSFWLGICDLGPAQAANATAAAPLLAAGLRHVAIEVVQLADPGEYAVLFSRGDGNDPPQVLECRIGFTNSARGCIAWRDRGFPLVDAEITLDERRMLTVCTPYFQPLGAQKVAPPLLVVGPVSFDADPPSRLELVPEYHQDLQAPDAAQPAAVVRRRGSEWVPERSEVLHIAGPRLLLTVAASRSPSLAPLATRTYDMRSAWSGNVVLPRFPTLVQFETQSTPRVDVFGVPAFRFDDVEALGFRIDLPRDEITRARLHNLVRPLNFHQQVDPARAPDFRYEAIGASVVIELLRYGKMRLMRQDAPLTLLDYQSQHELVVRLIVGRISDDGTPVREQAVFVPAIFVDNPWSKILGRDMQGFPKTLADFCIETPQGASRLASDGRRQAGSAAPPEALDSVKSIRMRDPTGGPVSPDWLMAIDCKPSWCSGWDAFKTVSPGLAIAGLTLAAAQGGWSDLSRLSYLASFLRTAAGQFFNGFRSVQSSPLGVLALRQTWVTGRFAVDDIVKLAFPLGSVSLVFNAPANAPAGWKKVCRLLSAQPSYDLHVSSWYRLRFSMSLVVDDGLEWTS